VKCDIIFAGVGGQGVLSLSSIIGYSAMCEGLEVKQTENHGMAQRGGTVSAHLRLSDQPVASNLISRGGADLLIAMEPLESLRYLPFLATHGTVISSTNPLINISDYPDTDALLKQITKIPGSIIVDCDRVAREAGSLKAGNIVLVGAAAGLLPMTDKTIEKSIAAIFARKGPGVVDTNVKAFRLGKDASIHTSSQTTDA